MKKINIYYTLIALIGVLFFYSCSENIEYPETRLFGPVLNKDLSAHLNTITVDLGKFKDAVSYKVEISRDTFKTVSRIKTYNTTESKLIISDLLWNRLYQVRATAIAASPEYNSKVTSLGAIKTEPFPSDLLPPTQDDYTDTEVKLRWTVQSGAVPVTSVKVFAEDDEELLNPLASYNTTNAEQLSGEKIVSNLMPNTTYQLAIYSGTTIKGWDFYKTLTALPVGAGVTDLRGLGVPTNTTLSNALDNTADGGTVILDPVQTYALSTSYAINKSITIKSGYTLANTTGAILNNASSGMQFEIGTTGNISKIVFDGVSFVGDASMARYVVNASLATSTTVGELRFVNCKMTGYRDLIRTRTQWTSGGIDLLTVDNCILTNFGAGAQAVVLVDGPYNTLKNLTFKNSTFSKIFKLTNHKATSSSASLIISDCTFSETPPGAGSLIDYTTTTNITGNIMIKNSIFGGSSLAKPASNYSFVRTGHLVGTLISSSNTYKTGDFDFVLPTAPATTPVPTFSIYSKTIKDLWVDPLNGNFYFNDKSFAGAKTAGDPRWRN